MGAHETRRIQELNTVKTLKDDMAFLKHQSYTRDESDAQMGRARADWMTRFDQHLLQVHEK